MAALISVEAAVFRPDFLDEMVRSALGQDFGDFELNIMIDGAGAEVENILDRYSGDGRLHVFIQANSGTGIALRNLAARTDSRYMAVLDDDDRLLPGALAAMAGLAEAKAGFSLVRSGMRFITDDGRPSRFRYRPRSRARVLGMTDNIFDVSQLYLFPRDLYDKVGGWVGDPGHGQTGADADLFARFEEQGPFVTAGDALYEKRIHTRNLARSLGRDRSRPDHISWLVGRMIERRRLGLEYLGALPVRTRSPFPFLDLSYRTGEGEVVKLRTIYPAPTKTRWREELRRMERREKRWRPFRARRAL